MKDNKIHISKGGRNDPPTTPRPPDPAPQKTKKVGLSDIDRDKFLTKLAEVGNDTFDLLSKTFFMALKKHEIVAIGKIFQAQSLLDEAFDELNEYWF